MSSMFQYGCTTWILLTLVACGNTPVIRMPAPPSTLPTTIPTQTEAPGPTVAPMKLETRSVPTPSATPPPTFGASQAATFYNLPPTKLTSATGLYASPNRSELIVTVAIPAGETVYVMGRNGNRSHLRVVWNTGVGWLPVSFTDYNGKREKLDVLPIFEREPPGCAIPITTQFGLNSKWTSNQKQRVAVVVDLFRSQFGNFPPTTLSLAVNGKEIENSRRQIVEQGQFSLKDVVFALPGDMQVGDTLGYLLQTSSKEPLTFMATIFSVPSNCKWKID
jgi:hypothetical protein